MVGAEHLLGEQLGEVVGDPGGVEAAVLVVTLGQAAHRHVYLRQLLGLLAVVAVLPAPALHRHPRPAEGRGQNLNSNILYLAFLGNFQ